MTEPSNFRLKDGRTIAIDNKDVQRIRILNDIVWEKTKATSLSITGTPNTVNPGKTFNLTAVITDSNGVGINGEVTFSGDGISGTKTIQASNGIATLQNVSTNNVGTHTYTARFEKTDIYLPSEDTTTIEVNKKTPILTIIGEKTIYDTWKIGAKLTDSDGTTVLKNYSVKLSIGGKNYTLTTNNKGIVSQKISGLSGSKEATFTYEGNNIYNSVTKKQKYTINSYKEDTLSFNNADTGDQNASNRTQCWIKKSNTEYWCKNKNVACYHTETISAHSGTYHTPDKLKISFKKGNVSSIKQATLTFTSEHQPGCKGAHLGGYFNNAPTVQLAVNGSTFRTGSGAKSFGRQYSSAYSTYYNTHGTLSQKITWGSKSVTSNPIVSIKYPTNDGAEEAWIRVYNIKFKVAYIPKQSTTFS